MDYKAGELPERVRRDVVDPQGSGDIVRRALVSAIREIDGLIAELNIMKERIHLESERVQRDIMGYASMSQAAMDSTKIIAESLTNFRKTAEPPTATE